ncbi:Plant UBX domain-containing protein 4 [Castilleja foliolosa]|uniref:Plant UBX domain-containing protein 4 n=1 Tax=Castilleja foliolosa TaxID=1961234 RepID=A0ABD3BDX2_9LAMI
MENESPEFTDEASLNNHPQIALINTFFEITACASKSEALFFLESHNFDVDAAVSTFLDNANPATDNPFSTAAPTQPQYSPSQLTASPARSRSPSPPPPPSRSYGLRSAAKRTAGGSTSGGRRRGGEVGGGGGIATLSDLNRNPKHDEDSDSDPDYDPQEYYTGGERSGMLVQDPSKANDVDEIFNKAKRAGAVDASAEHGVPSSTRSFAGPARLLSGDVPSTPQPPRVLTHSITFWRNGFTVNDGPLRRLDDPEHAPFLESVMKSECPMELAPANPITQVHVNLTRKEEDYRLPEKRRLPFRGTGRTLGSTSNTTPVESNSVMTVLKTTAPAPTLGLVVDQNEPSTSIQLRLADGTRMVSRFNHRHTIRDVRAFIDASRPDGPRAYQLQTMGFPPKQLADLDQTIEEAGITNSVVIQTL